jgi:FKBP-type peptidyl-prolyl cis-trans isomerase
MKRHTLTAVMFTSVLLLTVCVSHADKNSNNCNNNKGKTMKHKTNSGLEYEILQEGNGESPRKGKPVTVHYTGWLDNKGEKGSKFDSSVDRGQTFSFVIGVGMVIPGWDEGVMGMKVGEKRRLYIPAHLGYGARGAGNAIPPYANLIFDVELIKV